MLLESALFLHPHIASALVGQMAHSISKLATWEGKNLNKDIKKSFSAEDQDSPDNIPGEIEGDGDDYDPWACDSDTPCPTEPFEYECVADRCVPILPQRVLDDSTIRNVMAEQFHCWRADYASTRWCGAVYPKQWPRDTYPSWSYTLGEGTENESVKTARGGHPNALKLRNSVNFIPESGTHDWNVADMGSAITNSNGKQWFGKVQRNYLDYNVRLKDDDDVPLWRKILGGPLVWSGWLKSGITGDYLFQWVTGSCGTGCKGAKPHQWWNQIPSETPEEDRSGKYGMTGSQERYDLSRNANDYGWGEWITTPWYDECGGGWWPTQKRMHCCGVDCRCFSRVRYKTTLVPDPLDPHFIDASNGQLAGALYGLNANSQVVNHAVVIEVQGQDTSGTFTSKFKPAAGDEYIVTIYRYGEGSSVGNERVFTDSKGKGSFIYYFPSEGLYQFTVDRVVSGNGCITTQPSLIPFFDEISPYFINFGVFVNPPPPKRGCTNKNDMFYDADALIDDGNCLSYDKISGDGNQNTAGGKGAISTTLSRIDLTKDNMAMGVAVASSIFLGLVLFASSGGGD